MSRNVFGTVIASEAKQSISPSKERMDCFAEPVIGRRFAPTRWLAMTIPKTFAEASVIEPSGRGVLDTRMRGYDDFLWSGVVRLRTQGRR